MTTDDLRKWRFREPFVPFRLYLRNGDVAWCRSPENIGWPGPTGQTCFLYQGEVLRMIAISDIVAIEPIVDADDL